MTLHVYTNSEMYVIYIYWFTHTWASSWIIRLPMMGESLFKKSLFMSVQHQTNPSHKSWFHSLCLCHFYGLWAFFNSILQEFLFICCLFLRVNGLPTSIFVLYAPYYIHPLFLTPYHYLSVHPYNLISLCCLQFLYHFSC